MTGLRLHFATLLLLSVVSACAIQTRERLDTGGSPRVKSAQEKYAEMKTPGLKVKNDEFTGDSVAYTPLMVVGEDIELMVFGERSPNRGDVMIQLTNHSDHGWEYLRCHYMNWLADGKPVATSESTHDGSAIGGNAVIERIEQRPVSEAEFLRMATAAQVRGRVCDTQFQLQPSQIAELRSLAAWMGLIQPPLKPSSPGPASLKR